MGAGRGSKRRVQSAALNDVAGQLRRAKRESVREDAELWKQLPWLAALAHYREHRSEIQCEFAYSTLQWPLNTGDHRPGDDLRSSWSLAIDLREPRIVYFQRRGQEDREIREVESEDLDLVPVEELDIEDITRRLRDSIRDGINEKVDTKLRRQALDHLKGLEKRGLVLPMPAEELAETIGPDFELPATYASMVTEPEEQDLQVLTF